MLKTIFPKTAFLDLETVACLDTIRSVYDCPDADDEGALAIAYLKHGASPENPTPFLKLMLHKVIVSGLLYRSVEYVSQGIKEPTTKIKLEFLTLPTLIASDVTRPATEKEMIQRPLTFIGRNQAQVVGWNIDSFDWPVMIQRGLRNGVVIPDICKRPNKPWEGNDYYAKFSDARIDLMKVVAGEMSFGNNPKLSDTAIALSLPGKEGMDGSKVYDAWKEGRLAEIVKYCNHDCAMTYQIWLRVALMSGLLSIEQVEDELEQLRQLLEGS